MHDDWIVEINWQRKCPVASTGQEGLRSEVWASMGSSLGKSCGSMLGSQMDALILAIDKALIIN